MWSVGAPWIHSSCLNSCNFIFLDARFFLKSFFEAAGHDINFYVLHSWRMFTIKIKILSFYLHFIPLFLMFDFDRILTLLINLEWVKILSGGRLGNPAISHNQIKLT